MKTLKQGWSAYIGERFEDCANPQTLEIVVEPHQIDGLSYSMTLVNLILTLRLFLKERLTIVIMGATAKVEERLFVLTNYYDELTHFYPKT